MTADDKYSLRNSATLPQPIEMQLSKNLKTFSQPLTQFQQSTSKFKYFEQNMTLVAYAFSKLRTVKCMVRQMFKEPRFIAPSYCQHVEGSQTLVKSPWE